MSLYHPTLDQPNVLLTDQTLADGRGGRLPLSVRRVLGTSRDLYRESTGLLGAMYENSPYERRVVARGKSCWTQQELDLSGAAAALTRPIATG